GEQADEHDGRERIGRPDELRVAAHGEVGCDRAGHGGRLETQRRKGAKQKDSVGATSRSLAGRCSGWPGDLPVAPTDLCVFASLRFILPQCAAVAGCSRANWAARRRAASNSVFMRSSSTTTKNAVKPTAISSSGSSIEGSIDGPPMRMMLAGWCS